MASSELSGTDLLAWRRKQLSRGGYGADLDWLLDLAGGLRWTELQRLHLDPGARVVTLSCALEELESLWRRHLDCHEPLQHLVGCCPWRDFELTVSSAALIPRQETELLVDLALDCVSVKPNSLGSGRWADLGTGSGALAVALARALPHWSGHGVDCSEAALALARTNLERLAGSADWQLHAGDWWTPLEPWWGGLQLVVSNPPYIPASTVDLLDPVVRDYEPRLALDGGPDGLHSIASIVMSAGRALAPGGWLLMEHHHDQSEPVAALCRKAGLEDVRAERDLEGVARFCIARRSS